MELKYLHIFPFDNHELSYVFPGPRTTKPVVKVGDKIHFVPGVGIDGCKKAKDAKPFFNHIILNVYEFTFEPVLKVITEKSESDPLLTDIDYLIQFPHFTSYFSEFQFDDDMPFDLELNQLYTGYGKFGVYDFETFDLMPKPIRNRLQRLKLSAQVEAILDYEIYKTWRNNEDLRVYPYLNESLHNTDEYSEDIPYFRNFDQFKKNVQPFKKRVQEVTSNEKIVLPTYCLKPLLVQD